MPSQEHSADGALLRVWYNLRTVESNDATQESCLAVSESTVQTRRSVNCHELVFVGHEKTSFEAQRDFRKSVRAPGNRGTQNKGEILKHPLGKRFSTGPNRIYSNAGPEPILVSGTATSVGRPSETLQ
jgi:hypothetical protein